MDRTGSHHVKQNKPDTERQVSYVFSYSGNLKKKKTLKSRRRARDSGGRGGENGVRGQKMVAWT
jgi:hypothetical protein